MKLYLIKGLVILFYYLGDFFSKIPAHLTHYLYQKCMAASIFFDDIVGPYWWWKKPENNQNDC
jgi:hypothetical protein